MKRKLYGRVSFFVELIVTCQAFLHTPLNLLSLFVSQSGGDSIVSVCLPSYLTYLCIHLIIHHYHRLTGWLVGWLYLVCQSGWLVDFIFSWPVLTLLIRTNHFRHNAVNNGIWRTVKDANHGYCKTTPSVRNITGEMQGNYLVHKIGAISLSYRSFVTEMTSRYYSYQSAFRQAMSRQIRPMRKSHLLKLFPVPKKTTHVRSANANSTKPAI